MNIEEIRKKLKEAQGTKPQKLIWKPKGEHTVRMLALPGDADITETANWHYGVDDGRKMYCPSTNGEDCPFCDVAQALRSWRDSDGNEKPEAQRKQDFEAFKKIQSATKYYAPIIVRKTGDDPDAFEGPLWWEMTAKTREKLLEICLNEDYNQDQGDEGGGSKILTSTKKGLDLIVTLKKANTEGNKTSYDLTVVDERRRFTPLFKNKKADAVRELLESVPPLSDAFKPVSTAEAEKVFAAWEAGLTKETAQVDDNAGVERGESKNAEPTLKGGKSVEDILAQIDSMLPTDQAKA